MKERWCVYTITIFIPHDQKKLTTLLPANFVVPNRRNPRNETFYFYLMNTWLGKFQVDLSIP